MAGTGDDCPACNRALSKARAHCLSKNRTEPCDWIVCACGAVVDSRYPDRYITPDGKREVR